MHYPGLEGHKKWQFIFSVQIFHYYQTVNPKPLQQGLTAVTQGVDGLCQRLQIVTWVSVHSFAFPLPPFLFRQGLLQMLPRFHPSCLKSYTAWCLFVIHDSSGPPRCQMNSPNSLATRYDLATRCFQSSPPQYCISQKIELLSIPWRNVMIFSLCALLMPFPVSEYEFLHLHFILLISYKFFRI